MLRFLDARETLIRVQTGYPGYFCILTATGQHKCCVRKVTGRCHTSPYPLLPIKGGAFIHDEEDEGCFEEGFG